MNDSRRLIDDYARRGSEEAFRELVARYVNLVHSTALRLVDGDTHLAEDVTQTVFVNLARQAAKLGDEVMIGGWLHRNACFVAANAMRGNRRRQNRERQAVEMNAMENQSGSGLATAAPLLDEAIEELGPEDRTAILLRFFEQLDFRAVGRALGANEDAARMRVNRALEKLHAILKQRGVALSVAALGTALAAEAVTAAPAGMAAAAVAAALGGAATGGATLTIVKLMTMTKIKIAVVSALAIAALAAPVVVQQQKAINGLRQENDGLKLQITQLTPAPGAPGQVAPENANAGGGASLAESQVRELARLRNEVSRLRSQTNELTKARQEIQKLNEAVATEREAGDGKLAAYRGQVEEGHKMNACINNLRIIDSAKQQWALENRKRNIDTPTWDDLRPYLGPRDEAGTIAVSRSGLRDVLPACPAGGVYTIGMVGEKPTCNVAGHVLP